MRPTERTPYPGLRSFTRREIDIFFGRDDCIDAMLERLCETRFLAVLGPSGSGKSSLVKTGLLSALEMGLVTDAGTRWRVAEFTPGRMPLRNLARSLLEIAGQPLGGAELTGAVEDLRALLEQNPQAIVEWSRAQLGGQENLLLLVDQFEELFRYQDYAAQEEAEAFVRVLLESAEASRDRLYVTLTMRSEYLGPCALIEGLAEAISAGMFLIPRMSREQCREAIEGPAKLCGGEIDEPLGNRLLNDLARLAPWEEGGETDQLDRLARRADQLPLLQYTLNRMWLTAAKDGVANIKLTLDDYEKIGGLEGALNAQANDIFQSLDENQKAVAEAVFRALTEGTTIADAKRRPARFANLVRVWGDEEYENAIHAGRGAEYENVVKTVIETFAKPGCDFLKLDPGPEIVSDTVVDITHESIIRQWRLLSEWVKKEGEAGQEWQRLKAEAHRYNNGRGDLLSGQDLTSVESWWRQEKPKKAWAERYGGDYKAVATFVDESINARRRRKSLQYATYGAAGLLIFALMGTAWFGSSKYLESNRNFQLAKHNEELARSNEKLAQRNDGFRRAAKKYVEDIKPLVKKLVQEKGKLNEKMSTASRDQGMGMQAVVRSTKDFLDKPVLQLLDAQVSLTDGMHEVDPDDPDIILANLNTLTLVARWVSVEDRDKIESYTGRAAEIARGLFATRGTWKFWAAAFDNYRVIADTLDASSAERPRALERVDELLDNVRNTDPSDIGMPPDFLLYLTSAALESKGLILQNLNRLEEGEAILQEGVEKIEAWRRSSHEPCPTLAADLHNDLGALLVFENKRGKDSEMRKVRTNRAIAEYETARDCAIAESKVDDTIEHRRWVAIRAARLAQVHLNARKFSETRGDYELALKFRQLVEGNDIKATEENYDNAQAKRDVAMAQRSLGFFESRYGRKAAAVSYFEECIKTVGAAAGDTADAIDQEAHGLCEKGSGLALRRLKFDENGTSTLADAEKAYRAAIVDFTKATRERDEAEFIQSAWDGLAVTLLLDEGAKGEAVEALSKSFELQRQLLASARREYEKIKTNDAAESLGNELSGACWDAILNDKLDEAVFYADQGTKLQIEASAESRINYAHAYLLAGRVAEARQLYLTSKDRSEELNDIKEDFQVFSKLGLNVPEMDAIKTELGIS